MSSKPSRDLPLITLSSSSLHSMTRGCLSLRHSPSPSSTRSVFISFSGLPPPGHLHRPAVLTGLHVSFTNAAICHCPALAASPQGGTERKAATAWNAHASLLPSRQRTIKRVRCETHRDDWFLLKINPKLY